MVAFNIFRNGFCALNRRCLIVVVVVVFVVAVAAMAPCHCLLIALCEQLCHEASHNAQRVHLFIAHTVHALGNWANYGDGGRKRGREAGGGQAGHNTRSLIP